MVVYAGSDLLPIVLEALALQTIARTMEVILVAESPDGLQLAPGNARPFFSLRIVKALEICETGQAKALGVQAARAPLVMFLEDHSLPDPRCAEALVASHRARKPAAVGPLMLNANPSSTISWGTFLVFYGQWLRKNPRTRVTHLPANHSCYRREVLMRQGQRLAELLEAESVLHWELADHGEHLFLDPGAKVYHLNYSSVAPLLQEYFLASRVFAANRAARWRASTKAVYAIGSVLLPVVRGWRIARQAAEAQLEAALLLRSAPALFANLWAGAAGEMLGYLLGIGPAAERLASFERRKRKGYSPADVQAASRLLAAFSTPCARHAACQ